MQKTKAVIVAGGSSTRMNGIDKLFHEIDGRPVLAYALEAFQLSRVEEIIVVTGRQNFRAVEGIANHFKIDKFVCVVQGGAERQISVRNGLSVVGECDYVAVHDGARPNVSTAIINEGIIKAEATGISVPVERMRDTMYLSGPEGNGLVENIIDRRMLHAGHTPQIFRADIIKRIHGISDGDAATDDISLAQSLGYKVTMFPDAPWNLKITTQEDLCMIAHLLRNGNGNSKK